jgi:2-oxoisovalerate dehydrogenase E1 component
MSVFRNTQHLYRVLGTLFERALAEPEISQALMKSDMVVQFTFVDPEGKILLDLRKSPPSVDYDPVGLKPDVEFMQSGDHGHQFWLGELSLASAVATRKVVARGSVPKALALLPAIKPAFSLYRQVLREIGEEDLLPEKKASQSGLWGKLRRTDKAVKPGRADSFPDEYLGPMISFLDEGQEQEIQLQPQVLPADENEFKIEMMRRMFIIRTFEERLSEAFATGLIPSEALHLSIGQEACAVGACFALKGGDYMSTTHRGHGHMIAMGAGLKEMAAEIFAKSTGLCGGLGGAMHVTDASLGALGANGIVGASSLIAVGAGLSSQKRASGQVALAFMGDGATAQGMFHEAVNFAAVFNLPVIFFIENNRYAEFTPTVGHTKLEKISDRAKGYGIPGVTVDGNDVWAVMESVKEAAERARRGEGPTLIEGLTYRWSGHSEGDSVSYRPKEEIEAWRSRDPIQRWRKHLSEGGILTPERWEQIQLEVSTTIQEAFDFAQSSPEPEMGDVFSQIFAPEPRQLYGEEERLSAKREMTVSAAIHEALAEELARDDRVYLIGEDVRLGGYFAVTQGLVDQFGPGRIIDTPISEYAIVGSSVGAAVTGMRPVAEIEFSDFITCCMDPLVNQAAKLRFMSGGQYRLPLVVRCPGGGGIGMAAQHSQSLEAWLLHIPGLIIMAPGTAYDAKGLLKSAIRSNNPVLFFENKLLYFETGPVPEGPYLVAIGKAEVKRVGGDVTLISVGAMLRPALEASRIISEEGIQVEVVDPRTLSPCDWKTIADSARKTGRVMVLEGGTLTGGFGAECSARVTEMAWDALKRPVKRVAAYDVPIPYHRGLENAVIPDVERILHGIRSLFN